MQLASSANDDVVLGIAVGSQGGGTVQGGTCDVRAAPLFLLIGKCNAYQAALDEVGGNEFFRCTDCLLHISFFAEGNDERGARNVSANASQSCFQSAAEQQ